MTKNIFRSILIGSVLICSFSISLFAQSTQDYEKFFRDNPSLMRDLLNPDGSVNRQKLEELRRNPDSLDLPDHLRLDRPASPKGTGRSLLDIENDNRLQERLEEERMKAYERQLKREAEEKKTAPPN